MVRDRADGAGGGRAHQRRSGPEVGVRHRCRSERVGGFRHGEDACHLTRRIGGEGDSCRTSRASEDAQWDMSWIGRRLRREGREARYADVDDRGRNVRHRLGRSAGVVRMALSSASGDLHDIPRVVRQDRKSVLGLSRQSGMVAFRVRPGSDRRGRRQERSGNAPVFWTRTRGPRRKHASAHSRSALVGCSADVLPAHENRWHVFEAVRSGERDGDAPSDSSIRIVFSSPATGLHDSKRQPRVTALSISSSGSGMAGGFVEGDPSATIMVQRDYPRSSLPTPSRLKPCGGGGV